MRFLIALPFVFLSACGDAPAADESPRIQVAQVESERPASAPASPRRAAQDGDNSLVAAAAREADRRTEMEARGVRELGWEELMPEGEDERLAMLYQQHMAMLYGGSPIEEGSAADQQMLQIGTFNTVPELNGVRVRIPGYTVPFDFSEGAQISEFLLVPYFGACLHAPPPPPNQTLFIMTDDPIEIKDLAQAVWIEGTIYTQTQESELADAAYTIKMDRIETYEY